MRTTVPARSGAALSRISSAQRGTRSSSQCRTSPARRTFRRTTCSTSASSAVGLTRPSQPLCVALLLDPRPHRRILDRVALLHVGTQDTLLDETGLLGDARRGVVPRK